jgi:hypothetical protein
MSEKSATRFELWKAGAGYALFAQDNERARRLLEPGAKLAWSVEASSWNEARKRMYAFLSREPYRPEK